MKIYNVKDKVGIIQNEMWFMMKFNYCLLFVCLLFCLFSCEHNSVPSAAVDRKADVISRGQELYFSHGCAVCHGKEGRGDGMAAARFYPKPIDLHNPDAYTQGNSVRAIESTIKYGMQSQSSAMPKYDHLTGTELKDLAEYLKSLQTKEVQTKRNDDDINKDSGI